MHARITVIQPDPVSHIDLFGEWLPAQGVHIDLIDVEKDSIPNAAADGLDLGDGLIVLGGKYNAYSTNYSRLPLVAKSPSARPNQANLARRRSSGPRLQSPIPLWRAS